MDKRTVFADKLVLPRALKVLDQRRAGRRAAEPLADEGHRRRSQGRHQGARQQHLRPRRRHIEHNANSLFWAIDNTIYTSEHDWHLRCKNGKFETVPTLTRGQWGATQDDAGRVYRNVNDAPLFVDFVAARYYMRNPNLVRTRGLYDPLIAREDSTVWPVRADARRQPRLSRSVLPPRRQLASRSRASARRSSIAAIGCRRSSTATRSSPTRRRTWCTATRSSTTARGRLTAVDGYKKGEILASWDERFRPVNLLGGPDGTIYVVDMYRGVVQEADLLDRLPARLHQGATISSSRCNSGASGASSTTRPGREPKPALSKATPAAARGGAVAPERLVARHGAAAAGAARRQVRGAAADAAGGAGARLAHEAARAVDARRARRDRGIAGRAEGADRQVRRRARRRRCGCRSTGWRDAGSPHGHGAC